MGAASALWISPVGVTISPRSSLPQRAVYEVVLEAEDGSEVRLVTNAVGNFWTDVPLKVDGYAYLEHDGRTEVMGRNLPEVPACNACHSQPPVGGAPGRIYAP